VDVLRIRGTAKGGGEIKERVQIAEVPNRRPSDGVK
jgi:hypothetical protein